MSDEVHNVVIIGSGPAGYTAAIYTARAMLSPLLIAGDLRGGQLSTTTEVENYPGFPASVTGPELMEKFQQQACNFGATVLQAEVSRIDANARPFRLYVRYGDQILAKSIIIATGAQSIWLNAPGEASLRSNGISTCATCDGALFKNERLIVVGGGDSAMEEATFLTRFASEVTIIHRRNEFRASKIMLERARANQKIEWATNRVVTRWVTDENGDLAGAEVRNTIDETESIIQCEGAFIAIGHRPSTAFLDEQVELDSEGYIVNKINSMTSVPGIFSCGDVTQSSKRYKQAITAAGEGCQAAMDCEKWLEEEN